VKKELNSSLSFREMIGDTPNSVFFLDKNGDTYSGFFLENIGETPNIVF